MNCEFRFLCAKHRKLCVQQPDRAHLFWAKTLLLARRNIVEDNWWQSLTPYGNALEISAILLSHDADKGKAEIRFSRTVTEFIYALRSADRPADAQALLHLANQQLVESTLEHSKSYLMASIQQALKCSQLQVYLWIDQNISSKHTSLNHLSIQPHESASGVSAVIH